MRWPRVLTPEIEKAMLKHTPLGRLGEADGHRQCGAVPVFAGLGWVSGQMLTVSGGGVQELD